MDIVGQKRGSRSAGGYNSEAIFDRKEGTRFFWMVSIFLLKCRKTDTFSFRQLEKYVGYHDNGSKNPQSSFRSFLYKLRDKEILVPHQTNSRHPEYSINKKKLEKEIEKNQVLTIAKNYIREVYLLSDLVI